MQKLALTIDVLIKSGALSVSVYLLSKDNIKRKRDDLEAVLQAEQRFFKEILPILREKHNLKVFHAGDQRLLPRVYVEILQEICEVDDSCRTELPSLFLCAGYDPKDEILHYLSNGIAYSEEVVNKLWVPHYIDLVIRTGGDQRISGFLPLQCNYAELFFEPYFFPDINRERIEAIVNLYHSRQRRFGK